MIKKYFEEEVMQISIRLTEIVTYYSLIKRKNDLIKLLDKLNKLNKEILDNYEEDHKKKLLESKNNTLSILNQPSTIKDTISQGIEISADYGYLFGRINILKSIINSLIEKIIDLEEENKLTEKDKEIIEESKKEDDLNYMG